jgi:hypothetical protein
VHILDQIILIHVEEDFGLFDTTEVQPGSKRIDTTSKLSTFGDVFKIDESGVIRQFCYIQLVSLLCLLLMQFDHELRVFLSFLFGLRRVFCYS